MKNTEATYEVWFEPTPEGCRAFGWQEHRISGPYRDKDDADFARYEADSQEAFDFSTYARYSVRETMP